MGGYEAMELPLCPWACPAEQLLLPIPALPAHGPIVGQTGLMQGMQGFLPGAGGLVQRTVLAWKSGSPLPVREPPSLCPLKSQSLPAVIPLLQHSDVHLVQERKRRRQSWKSCMETLMLWSFTQACCSRNRNPMAFLGKAWWRLELRFP